jgi:hypothetical protein
VHQSMQGSHGLGDPTMHLQQELCIASSLASRLPDRDEDGRGAGEWIAAEARGRNGAETEFSVPRAACITARTRERGAAWREERMRLRFSCFVLC